MTETTKAVMLSIPKIVFSKKSKRVMEQVKRESAGELKKQKEAVEIAGRMLFNRITQNQSDLDYITELFLKLDRAKKYHVISWTINRKDTTR